MTRPTPQNAEKYGDAEVTARGRIVLPDALYDDLEIDAGTTFTVLREGSTIKLVRELPHLRSVSTENRPTKESIEIPAGER